MPDVQTLPRKLAEAAVQDPGLPEDYRRRVAVMHGIAWREKKRSGGWLLVTRRALAGILALYLVLGATYAL